MADMNGIGIEFVSQYAQCSMWDVVSNGYVVLQCGHLVCVCEQRSA